ncbi:ATP-grasp domain-containing protein [Streptomyces sp. NPDC013181]|uniref:ATP-grasp domain-containing protein n=1 Tax=Streptomyces sp. NPDC013181 TaxID=3364864 RepID=UPI0036928D51
MSHSLPGTGERRTRVLIVEPVSSGTRMVEDAHRLGFEVVVASAGVDDRSLPPGFEGFVDTLLTVDTNDERALADAVVAYHAEHPLDALVPGAEFYIPAVTRLVHRLGLPGLPLEAVDLVRNKALMRERTAEAGLRVPRHVRAGTPEEVERAAETIGFPCVIKPVESSGSIHVRRADTVGELLAAYAELAADRRLDLGFAMDTRVVVEEYVTGPEFSADGYVHDGEVVVLSVTRKLLGPEPYFVELGHIVPSAVPPLVRERVTEYVRGVTEAVRITSGPFHCELRLPGDEPVLIEIAARLPGDRITELVQLSTGTSMSRAMLAAYLGRSPQDLGADVGRQVKCAGIRYFTAPDLTRYSELKGWDAMAARPEVTETGVVIAPGEEIPPLHDFRGRIGYALFSADSPEQAQEIWRSLGETVVPVP